MKQPTPENVRFHAAGHLAAASALVEAGMTDAARLVLRIVAEYASHEKVECPPAIKTSLDECISEPAAHKNDILSLEVMFCSELNTLIEKSGGMGAGFGGRA